MYFHGLVCGCCCSGVLPPRFLVVLEDDLLPLSVELDELEQVDLEPGDAPENEALDLIPLPAEFGAADST